MDNEFSKVTSQPCRNVTCIVRNSSQSDFLATRARVRIRGSAKKRRMRARARAHRRVSSVTNDSLSAVDVAWDFAASRFRSFCLSRFGKLNRYNISATYCISLPAIRMSAPRLACSHKHFLLVSLFVLALLSRVRDSDRNMSSTNCSLEHS